MSALSYYGYRYYDSLSLAWTQADPIYRFAPDAAWDAPRAANLYVFSLNNPMRYEDPDGRAVPAVLAGCAASPACVQAVASAVAATAGAIVGTIGDNFPTIPEPPPIKIDGSIAVPVAAGLAVGITIATMSGPGDDTTGPTPPPPIKPADPNGNPQTDDEQASDTSTDSPSAKSGATDSSKAEKHGDRGRAMEKAKKQIAKLKATLAGKPKKEQKKMERIRKAAEKARSGTNDNQTGIRK